MNSLYAPHYSCVPHHIMEVLNIPPPPHNLSHFCVPLPLTHLLELLCNFLKCYLTKLGTVRNFALFSSFLDCCLSRSVSGSASSRVSQYDELHVWSALHSTPVLLCTSVISLSPFVSQAFQTFMGNM